MQDAALLQRINNLANTAPSKIGKLDDLYKNQDLPGDRPLINGVKADADFTVSRQITIKGQTATVSIYYDKNGFPDFTAIARQYGGSEFVYRPTTTLKGKGSDMIAANAWAQSQSRK